ncbi:MAG: anti-sigma factor [Pseudomonadota bacterium]
MNYARSALLDRLAGAYVLGTLSARARRRFQRLCDRSPEALAARLRWEDRLLPLAMNLRPVQPAARTWAALRAQLFPANQSSRSSWWPAALAASLLIVLLVGRFTIWKMPQWQDMAALAEANAAPLWQVERTPDSGRISIHTVGEVTLAADRSYELWILPGGNQNPVSLGLLPRSGTLQRELTANQKALLASAAQLAVSVEPVGGSPTGLPTGPVVIVAPVTRPG